MRYQKLDALRGVAIILMVAFHANYLLVHVFDSRVLDFSPVVWYFFGRVSVILFILIFGFSFFLSSLNKTHRAVWGNAFRRAVLLGTIALAITVSTYLLIPEQFIVFGIIHFFAVSSLLLPIFARFGMWNGVLWIYIIALGWGFWSMWVENGYLFPIGLMTPGFASADYYPIFPWFGLVLMGYALARWLGKRGILEEALSGSIPAWRQLSFVGMHSLLIYILHTPVLYMLFSLLFRK